MLVKEISLISLLFSASFFCFAQKDSCEFILVDKSPSAGSEYYMASNINGWNPADEHFKFKKDKNGIIFLKTSFDKGIHLEYKFTKGNWDNAECAKTGADIDNRHIQTDTAKFLIQYVQGWKNNFQSAERQHTASLNVKIIDTAFFIPQLNKKRRIWIYLPTGYAATHKRYPVMYMQDGQNVFDSATSAYGEWGVDECLDTLEIKIKKACIVVAIDNGGESRMSEYNPYEFIWKDSILSKTIPAEGDAYVDFLVKTLKPFIDKHYRTLTNSENTIIAGSSMGGLISYYAMLKYPKVFGKGGIFSPAFWTAPKIKTDTDSLGGNITGKLFFYIGGLEGQQYVDDMNDIQDRLSSNSSAEIYSVTDPEEHHNEKAWRKWFAEFYKWIMADGYNDLLPVQ